MLEWVLAILADSRTPPGGSFACRGSSSSGCARTGARTGATRGRVEGDRTGIRFPRTRPADRASEGRRLAPPRLLGRRRPPPLQGGGHRFDPGILHSSNPSRWLVERAISAVIPRRARRDTRCQEVPRSATIGHARSLPRGRTPRSGRSSSAAFARAQACETTAGGDRSPSTYAGANVGLMAGSPSLFWRVFAVNAGLLGAIALLLLFSPVEINAPIRATQALIVLGGLVITVGGERDPASPRGRAP